MYNEKDLIDRYIKNSDQKAFGKIYHKHFDTTYRFVFSRVGNQTWTEDIVSETFISLSVVLKSYNGESKLQSFIIGIAINKIKQFWVKSKFNQEAEFDERSIIVLDEENEVDFEKEEQLRIIVNKILPKLKETYQKVLVERFINNKTIKEAALAMKISEGNIRVLQNRALKKAVLIANEYLKQNNNEKNN